MYTEQSTPDELLHAYIDAELAPELEQQFFSMLASDGELRTRLRELRGIRTEARRFGAVAAPPPELTGAVFQRLGFESGSAVRPTHLLGAALLLRNAWAPITSAAAAAILTATLIFGLQGTPSNDAFPALADRQPNAITAPQSGTSATNQSRVEGQLATNESPRSAATQALPTDTRPPASRVRSTRSGNPGGTMQSADDGSTNAAPAFAEETNPRPAMAQNVTESGNTVEERNGTEPVRAVQQSGNNPALADNAAGQPDASVPFDDAVSTSGNANGMTQAPIHALTGEDASVLAQQGIAGQDPVDTRRYFPGLNREPLLSFLSIELRGVSAASFPDVTIGTRSNPWMANMAAAVYYSDEQDDFGLEYGQEPFSQHYHGIENGKQIAYEQNLLTSWILLGYRHRFTPMMAYGSIEPYVSTSIGTTIQAWPLARAGFGLMYMPDRRVRFHLGLEGSLLAYPYQNTWFTSKRAGLTYGISLLL